MQWIPVSERLPDYDTDYPDNRLSINVLVWGLQDEETARAIVGFYRFRYSDWVDAKDEDVISAVSHWTIITPPTEGE